MWVSTTPWQSGKMVCYSLKNIFENPDFSRELADKKLTIAADSTFIRNDYARIVEFRALAKQIKKSISADSPLSADSLNKLVAVNPNMYHTYELLGNYYAHFDNPAKAALS